jgi:hypothetical protein
MLADSLRQPLAKTATEQKDSIQDALKNTICSSQKQAEPLLLVEINIDA